jgi:hypothetical protein
MQTLKKSRLSLTPLTDNGLTTPEAVQHTVTAEGIIAPNQTAFDKMYEERCTLPAFVPSAASVCGLLSDGMQRREAVGIRHLAEGHAYEEAVWI